MAKAAVFLDRDRTLMEDPAPSSEGPAVKLLPGVELALKSLAQAGFKLVVVTNQPGIARGLLSEEALAGLHAELRRQLEEKGAHLDAIYYSPYHPEGTVDRYARDSDDRMPRPGMLQQAAEKFDLDLARSWMVGDGPRGIEAGQRASCRTVRVRGGSQETWHGEEPAADEDVQADHTVRNLVEAARVILREKDIARRPAPAPATAAPRHPTAAELPGAARRAEPEASVAEAVLPISSVAEPSLTPAASVPLPAAPLPTAPELPRTRVDDGTDVAGLSAMSDSDVLHELLRHARQMVRLHHHTEFSITKLLGGLCQCFAVLALVFGAMIKYLGMGDASISDPTYLAVLVWIGIAVVFQLMALTFFVMSRQD